MNITELPQFVSTASNVVLVVITAAYVVLTFKILKANQRTVDVMERQADALIRPYIVVDAFTNPGEPFFRLRIRNLGGTSAKNLGLTLDRPFYALGNVDQEHNLTNYPAFKNAIPAFVPRAELIFNLAESFRVLNDENSGITPSQFTVTARYEYSGGQVEEKNVIDLSTYHHAALNVDQTVEELRKIREAVQKMKP